MQLVLNNHILRKENGEWGAPSADQEQLTALTAELNKFKSSNSNFENKQGQGLKPKPKDWNKDKKKSGKSKKKQNNDEKWAWKKIPPANGEANTKELSGKTYPWYIKYQAWTLRTSEQCFLPQLKPKNTNKRTSISSKLEDTL